MKTRGVAIQAALAAAGLIAAYLTWQRPADATPGSFTLVDATRAQVELVRYEEEGRFVEVRPDPASDETAWLRLSAVAPPVPTATVMEDGGTIPAAAAAAQATPERELRGGEPARDLLGRFAPLRASRALGVLPAEKLEELGLTDSKKSMTVATRGGQRTFKVSTKVLGSGNPYLLDERTGEVFLLGPGIIADLEAADTRLVDRRLHTFRIGEFDSLVVQRGESSRTFNAQGKPPQEVQLVPASGEGAGAPDEFTRNWHGRLWRSVPAEVFGKGETPEALAASPELRVVYLRGGKELGYLEVARGAQGELFARSEHTAGWVMLHATSAEVIEESRTVAGAQ